MMGRDARTLSLRPAVTGLVLANLLVIGAAIASLLVARRAWALREDALAALAEARAPARTPGAPSIPGEEPQSRPAAGRAPRANVRAPIGKLRAATMDRILLWGSLGAIGSAFFCWRLITRSRTLVRSYGPAGRRRW
jgi:hypothetical protein